MQATELPPSQPVRDPIGERIGSYRIVKLLGRGGCGSVWLAEHEVIGSKVAIKILRPEVINIPGVQERFVTEARAASTIPSNHVARYTDLGQLPTGEPYAIMEYLEGETVHARIARQGRLTIADALAVTRQAAETLALAHEASIIHRDIKPENIFLVGPATAIHIKVLDFGIAKLIGDAMQSAHQTASGAFVGTPAYCAPEQLCGTGSTTAVDMYALGTTLYEMLTGSLPYDLSNPEFLVMKVSDPAPRVRASRPEVSERLDALVAAMLAASPSARPATMRELIAELARVDEPLQHSSRPLPVAATRRSHVRTAVLVGAFVASAAIVFAIVFGKRDPIAAPAPAPPPPSPSAAVIPDAMPASAPVTAAPPAEPAPVEAPPAPTPVRAVPRPTVTKKARPVAAPSTDVAPVPGKDVIIADPFER